MKWPQHLDYIEAIQHPTFCFGEPALRQATPVCDRFGVPRAASGNFACVFQVVNGRNRWAVRCFTRAAPNVRRRYARLTEHLSEVRVSSLVGFSYLEQGIRIRGNWHPVVKMEWVEGITLPGYVEAHLNQPHALRQLARDWNDVARELRQHRIAHGDLQHGNILVLPKGGVRLVDYDAMYIPAFRRELSPELGHPNWQHPGRAERDYDENLDTFASLVLTASLEALAVDSSLWRFHNGENLIFTRQDFEAPLDSELFHSLTRIRDRPVRTLTAELESRCLGRPGRSRFSLPRRRASSKRLTADRPEALPAARPTAVSYLTHGAAAVVRIAATLVSRFQHGRGWMSLLIPISRTSPTTVAHPSTELPATATTKTPAVAWYLSELPPAPSLEPQSPWRRFRQRMARDRQFAFLVWVCAVCGALDLIVLTIWWFHR